MKKTVVIVLAFCLLSLGQTVFANSTPSVKQVIASPMTDGSGVVNISYTLGDVDNDRCTVSVVVSNDGGSTWTITPSASALDGHLTDVSPGRRYITWNSKIDLPGEYGTNYRIKVIADDNSGPDGMVFVHINNDPGVSGHEGFDGYMSKYETTNAQYCQYLNAALATDDIRIQSSDVYGNSGPYSGQIYYDMDDVHAQISYSGGVFFVETRNGYYMGNHPVVEISWYGATAFADNYGYRLPTEWEWQAVADHYGEFTYGCGTTINHSKANYDEDNPLNLSSYPYTTPVDYYETGGRPGPYGYGMCDMAGNVWEWTSTVNGSYRIFRGGSWSSRSGSYCSVSLRYYDYDPSGTIHTLGFRVCR